MDKLENYDYYLPSHLIATTKIRPSHNSKLLIYNREKNSIKHTIFKNISSFIPKDMTMIFNNTKVIKARIFGTKDSGGKCELLLNKHIGNNIFQVIIKGKVKIGTVINFKNNLKAEILKTDKDGTRYAKFYQKELLDFNKLIDILEDIGHIPLPPYIKREDNKKDIIDYQSIFAKYTGSVAAPTASLHFTKEVMDTIDDIQKSYLTLHVGLGTFQSVQIKDITKHKMHSEYYFINNQTASLINSNQKILAIGTTTARTIEYFYKTQKQSGSCNIFLHPNNKPTRINGLLTNFHLPKSTLIMLVSSFIGLKKTLEIYNIAIEKKYRFYSYGDAMLIL